MIPIHEVPLGSVIRKVAQPYSMNGLTRLLINFASCAVRGRGHRQQCAEQASKQARGISIWITITNDKWPPTTKRGLDSDRPLDRPLRESGNQYHLYTTSFSLFLERFFREVMELNFSCPVPCGSPLWRLLSLLR